MVAVGAGIAYAYLQFSGPGPLSQKTVVQIPKNASRNDVATLLKERGVINSAAIFSGALAVEELARHVRPKSGEYEFPASASMQDVLLMMSQGRYVTYKITFPEGWTSEMMVNRLNSQEMLEGTINKIPPEGSLMPDTYIVTRGSSREKILSDMQAANTRLLDQQLAKLSPDSPIKNANELLTLASIVEKETGLAEERPTVAAVFLNRLKQRIKLQSDPTVIYGIVGGKGKLDRPITRLDLDTPTPYNTYSIDALPPGPIANPGKAAIEAVLNPSKVTYLYFVANGTGGHAFASTLEEHNANVKKWRAINGETEPSAPKPAPQAPPAPVASTPAAPKPVAPPAPSPQPTPAKPVVPKPAAPAAAEPAATVPVPAAPQKPKKPPAPKPKPAPAQ